MFKEGQKVWDSHCGWGKVITVCGEDRRPIGVRFDKEFVPISFYTKEGTFYSDGPRCLFFAEVIPQAEALNPPVEHLDLKRGDAVVINTGHIFIVVENSGKDKESVMLFEKLPESLDEAYDGIPWNKKNIKKVLGNVND